MKNVSLRTLRLLFPILFILFLAVVLGIAVWQLMRYRSCCEGMDMLRREVQSDFCDAYEASGKASRLLTAINSKPTVSAEDLDEYVFRASTLERLSVELYQKHRNNANLRNLNLYAMRISADARLCRALVDDAHDPTTAEELRSLLRNALMHLDAAEKSLQGWHGNAMKADAVRVRNSEAFVTHLFRFMMFAFALAAALYLIAQMLMTIMTKRALSVLGEGTRKFRDGQMDFRFDNIVPDEIGQVKNDFNLMALRLQRYAKDLESANDELRSQAESLIEAQRHKDRFLANVSHELRTPLNSIVCFTELIRDRAGKLNTEKETAYAEKILAAAEHLLSLITSLLDLAKCNAGTLTPSMENFDLSKTVAELCELLCPLAREKGLNCDLDIRPDICVKADKRMVRQIFMNLFSNAVKYTFQGGITVRLHVDGGNAALGIRDTGIGISEAEQAKLFQDFYRVESAAKKVVDGAGIGLALSRRMARMNHGDITFSSTDKTGESGSEFTLTLPLNNKETTTEIQE